MKIDGRSDVGGGPRTGGMSRLMTSTLFVLLMMATSITSETCRMINQWNYTCVSAGQTSVTVSCSANYQVTILYTAVYQLSAGACPATVNNNTVNGACQQLNSTDLRCQSPDTISSTCVYNITSLSPAAGCSGPYIVVTEYRCVPVFNMNMTTSTGTTVTQSSNATTVSSAVAFGNGVLFNDDTTRIFTAYIPGGVEAIASVRFFSKLVADSSYCASRLEVLSAANNQTVATFCNSTSPEVSLGCGSAGRFFYIRYVSGNPPVKVLYVLLLTVPQNAALIAQGGNASVPLALMFTTGATAPSTAGMSTGQSPVNNENPTTASSNGSLPASPASGSNGNGLTLGVIIGASVAGGVVILAVIIGVVMRFRSVGSAAAASAIPKPALDSPRYASMPPPPLANYQLDPHAADSARFRNITEFYIDGNSTSKLILNRKPEPPVFKTVVKV